MSEMTRSDRKDLAVLARKRAKVATKQLDARIAALEADLEEQLATQYTFDDDEVWAEVARTAQESVAAAVEDARIRTEQRFHELGVPKWAQPEVVGGVVFTGRGQNAVNERRVDYGASGRRRKPPHANLPPNRSRTRCSRSRRTC